MKIMKTIEIIIKKKWNYNNSMSMNPPKNMLMAFFSLILQIMNRIQNVNRVCNLIFKFINFLVKFILFLEII